MDAFFSANRLNWDERAGIHNRDRAGGYSVEAFKRGFDKLTAIEDAEIGGVSGLDLLHLQCHFGMDTLSLARRGARVTGIDFSPVAIDAARALATQTGLDARFVRGDVHDAPALIADRFDVVFASWGAINWIPDLRRWMAVAATMLRPGDFIYLLDSHPATTAILVERDGLLTPGYDWRTTPDAPQRGETARTYTGDTDILENQTTFEWVHPLSVILAAVREAGLALEFFHEHEFVSWQAFPLMERHGERLWGLPPSHPRLPLSFSIRAVKPA